MNFPSATGSLRGVSLAPSVHLHLLFSFAPSPSDATRLPPGRRGSSSFFGQGTGSRHALRRRVLHLHIPLPPLSPLSPVPLELKPEGARGRRYVAESTAAWWGKVANHAARACADHGGSSLLPCARFNCSASLASPGTQLGRARELVGRLSPCLLRPVPSSATHASSLRHPPSSPSVCCSRCL